MRLRLSVDGDVQLKTRDGTVVGQLENVTVNLDKRAISELFGGAMGGNVVDVPNVKVKDNPHSPHDQASFLPDPVDETWELYVTLLERPKIQLQPKYRKWIADAHEKAGVELTRQAIRGLAASEYHRENGYIGLEYAIVPKRGQSIEGRVAFMAAKAPQGQSANETMTVDQLIETFPPENRQRVMDMVLKPIVNSLINKHDPEAVDEGARQLRQLESWGYELVIEGERVTGARRK